MAESPLDHDEQQTLRRLRLQWGLSLLMQATVLAVVVWLQASGRYEGSPGAGRILAFVAVALLAVLTPAAYFVRNQFYKRWWQGDRITPRGYATGNKALYAMIEFVSLFAATAVIIGGLGTPAVYVALVAIFAFILNFPTGNPMRPTAPRLGDGS